MNIIHRRVGENFAYLQETANGKERLGKGSNSEEMKANSIAIKRIPKKLNCFESIKLFFLKLFHWKWVPVKGTDLLINVNSVVKRLGIQPCDLKRAAKKGEEAFIDGLCEVNQQIKTPFTGALVFDRSHLPFTHDELMEKAEEQFRNEPRKEEILAEISRILNENNYAMNPLAPLHLRTGGYEMIVKEGTEYEEDVEATAKLHELQNKTDSFFFRRNLRLNVEFPPE